MRRSPAVLPVCAALFFALLACNTGTKESEPLASSQTEESAEPAPLGAYSDQATPSLFGKRCYANCNTISVGSGSCPLNIGGFGNTTFLGGCGKACRKAQGDAAGKLPAGCIVNACSFSGC